MKIESLKINGEYYRPTDKGVQNPEKYSGFYYPVCYIKKLLFGFWRVDYFDQYYPPIKERDVYGLENQFPNVRIIVHSKNVEEIKYRFK